MPVSEAYVVHGVKSASPSFSLTQLTNSQLSPKVEELKAFSAGHPYPQFTGVKQLVPAASLNTSQLATLLAQCGLDGVDLSGGDVLLEMRKVLTHGTRDSSGHLVATIPDSFLYWDSITLPHNAEGSASATLAILYNGTDAPLTVAGGSLSITQQAAEQFCAGKVTINGTQVFGVQQITINSGVRWVPLSGDGDVYPTLGYVEMADPVVTIRTTEASWWETIGDDGLALTSLVAYGRRMKLHDTRYADNSSNHLKFSGTAGLVTIDNSGGGGNTRADLTLRVSMTAPDASTKPLIVQTGQAIA